MPAPLLGRQSFADQFAAGEDRAYCADEDVVGPEAAGSTAGPTASAPEHSAAECIGKEEFPAGWSAQCRPGGGCGGGELAHSAADQRSSGAVATVRTGMPRSFNR